MADHLHYALLGVFDILHSDVSVSGGQFYEKLFFVDLFLFNAAESATILKIFFILGTLLVIHKTCFTKSVLLIVL